jgi:hypothetical protein
MIDKILHLRTIESKDWATVLFVFSFALIAIARTVFESRFSDFVRLIYSDKYINLYKDGSNITSGFTILLFIVQLISFSFFIQFSLVHFDNASKTDWILFIRIITLLFYFVIAKFLIEKIIANAFNIEEFVDQFNLQKVIFRTYISLFILPLNVFLFYNDVFSSSFLIIINITVLIFCCLSYLISIKNYQNLIFSKLFYFILYLCALEIGPYYFIYYWLTKGIA